jgi:hypothetical protein
LIDSDTGNEFVQELSENLHLTDTSNTFDLDLTFVLDDDARPTNQCGDTGSVRSTRSCCQPKISIELASSDEEEETETSKEARVKNLNTDTSNPMNKPSNMSINTDTKATLQLKRPARLQTLLLIQNSEFLLRFLQSIPQSTTGESATPSNQTDPHNAYPNVEGDEAAS